MSTPSPSSAPHGPAPSLALPPALQPWRQWLVWFPPSLAGVLGDLLRQLHPLLGPLAGRQRQARGEPDGVDGLHTRGPYERLLASEWLLAQDLPDEFMRRAASGEHLFLAPRHAAPQLDRQIVALFDAGPLQLGAPRLAHIAWWILLARRAAEAGAMLRWGFLQAPGVLHDARQAHDLERLRHGRSFAWADASHWARWEAALAASTADPAHEHWWVGGTPASVPPPAAPAGRMLITHAVQVCRGLDGDSLSLTVTQRGQVRSLELALPAASQGALLLQGTPAQRSPQARAGTDAVSYSVPDRLTLTRPPVFSEGGRRVAVVGTGNGAWVNAFQHRRLRQGPRWQPWSGGAEPLSLFFLGSKRLAGLMRRGDVISGWQLKGLRAWKTGDETADAVPKTPPGTSRWLPALGLSRATPLELCVLDAAGVLWVRTGAGGWSPVDTGVIGLLQVGANVVYATAFAGQWAVRVMSPGDSLRFFSSRLGPAPAKGWTTLPAQGGCVRAEGLRLPGQADTVHFSLGDDGGLGACAGRLRRGSEAQWQVVTSADPSPRTLTLEPKWRLLGLVSPDGRRHELLCLADDGRRLFRLGASPGMQACYTAPDRVLHASVCPASGRVAMLTMACQLIVFNTRTDQLELVVHSAGAAEESE